MAGIDEAVERSQVDWAIERLGYFHKFGTYKPKWFERGFRPATDFAAILADREEARELLRRRQLFDSPSDDPVEFERLIQSQRVDTELLLCAEALASQQTETIRKLVEGLGPFADVAENDIGSDEHDDDTYQAMTPAHRRVPAVSVGHLRRAASLLATLSLSDEGEKG